MVNRAKAPKDVVFSKIYINLLNELVFRSLLVQLLIVGAYFTILQVVNSEFRSELRITYDDLVSDTMEAAMNIQKSNLMAQLEDRIDLLLLHSHLFNNSLLGDLSPSSATIVSLSSGASFSNLAFYIDQQPTANFASLSDEQTDIVQEIASSLGELNDNLVATEDDGWIVALAASVDIADEYFTVIKTVNGRSVDLSAIFSYAQACTNSKVCMADCGASGSFRFSCLTKQKGLHFSPLRWSNDDKENSKTYVYSVQTEKDTVLTYFFISDSENFKKAIVTPGIQATILNSATNSRGESVPVIQYLGLNKKGGTSEYLLDPLNTNHSTVMTSWLKDLTEKSTTMPKNNENFMEVSFSSGSLWGHTVFGTVQMVEKYFKNFSNHTGQDALSTDFIENLILISIFILNFLTLLG